MAQHIIQIPLEKITYIDYNNPNTNYMGQPTVKLGGPDYYEDHYINDYQPTKFIFLQYNLNKPQGKKTVSVKLYLYSVGESGTSTIPWREMDSNDEINWDDPKWVNSSHLLYTFDGRNGNADVLPGWVAYNVNESYITTTKLATARICTRPKLDVHSQPNYVFNSNAAASNKPYFELVYEDLPPRIPTLIEPIGIYTDNQSIIRFKWQYNRGMSWSEDTQKAFDLQWSTDQISWQTINQTTPNNYYDMPSGTLPSGNIYWRVRTYNVYDEVSDFSDVFVFYATGASQKPVIGSITKGTARPIISWTADGQQLYQMQVLQGDNIIYDSDSVSSMAVKDHKVQTFLEDGAYTARVRVKNEYDLWSGWGDLLFTIQTDKPEPLELKVFGMKYGAKLTFVGILNYALVYRKAQDEADYMCIAKAAPGQTCYDDYTVVSGKIYSYFLRHVSSGESFADSSIVRQPISIQHTQVAPAAEPANVFILKYNLNAPPDKKENKDNQKTAIHFDGRKYPVDEYSGFGRHDITCTFFLSEKEIDDFYLLFDNGNIVLYRDKRGRKIYGSLSNLTTSDTYRGRTISFTVSRVNYAEGIEV